MSQQPESGSRWLVSFDIDGTMEFGDPAGLVRVERVRELAVRGHVVGSGSDRTVADQQRLWERHDLEVHFVGHKHHLHEVRERFEASRWIHIGDTQADEYYALQAGFEFYWVDRLPAAGSPGWLW